MAVVEIAGHANETMTCGLYGKALQPEAQLPVLTRLAFGVDLRPLKEVWKSLMAPSVWKSSSALARKVGGAMSGYQFIHLEAYSFSGSMLVRNPKRFAYAVRSRKRMRRSRSWACA